MPMVYIHSCTVYCWEFETWNHKLLGFSKPFLIFGQFFSSTQWSCQVCVLDSSNLLTCSPLIWQHLIKTECHKTILTNCIKKFVAGLSTREHNTNPILRRVCPNASNNQPQVWQCMILLWNPDDNFKRLLFHWSEAKIYQNMMSDWCVGM